MYLSKTVQREPLIWFADEMEKRLQANDCKGKTGWRDCPMDFLQVKLLEELSEAMMAIRGREPHGAANGSGTMNVVEELADAANILMMMADLMHEKETRDETPDSQMGGAPPGLHRA